jgi:hypothetical protein
MEGFTPAASLLGGALIGLAAVLLMALNGRIAGVSGIASGLLAWRDPAPDWRWRAAFVAGLVLAPPLLRAVGCEIPAVAFVGSGPVMVLAGLLVGFGTVLGNGCTSGHGVCGVARGSARSLTATAVFMAAGFATVFLLRHGIGRG